MQPSSTRFEQKVIAYTRQIIKWRWLVVIGTLLLVFLAGSRAGGLFFDTNYRAFFSDENPQLQAFEKLQNVYTQNDNILFVLAPKNGKVFTPDNLVAIESLTESAWRIPFAMRVDAVTNFQHTWSQEDDLIVEDLVSDAESQPLIALDRAKNIAIDEPFLKDRIINQDASVTGVNVTLQFQSGDASELPTAVAYARQLADDIRQAHPDIAVHITGIAMLNNAFMEVSQNEMGTLLPIMMLVMILIMIFALRSFSGTFATMLLLTFSVGIAMGFGGLFNIGLTPPSAQAPTIILTLAIADSIHILVSMLREMRRGSAKYEAIIESIRVNFGPVFLTSLSTVIGFLSLNFSDVPPFNHLGNITAVGVTAAFLLSVSFLPALMAILPVRVRSTKESTSPLMDRFANMVIRRRQPLLWGSALTMLVLTALIPMNELDDRFVEYFDERIEFRTDTDFATENLTGVYQIEFSLGGGESGSISNPVYLDRVEAFANWYREQPHVIHVNSFTDVMKRLNKNMHGDDPAYYRLPDSRELAAQYLLLYEMSLPYGLDLNNQINVDKSATRFTVTLNDISSAEIRELSERGRYWLENNAPAEMHATGSGPMVMFAYISGINIRSMLIGSTAALLLISLLMIFALRSVKLGLISFIPNLIPAAVAFGIWGLTSGNVNLGLSVVIGMTMGIVVDDSIHFLSKYRRARREKKMDEQDAVRYAFSSVGIALTVTSLILVAGFAILATSAFDMNASMGKMTALTIAIALMVDFFFLPPLLIWLDKAKKVRRFPRGSGVPAPVFNTNRQR